MVDPIMYDQDGYVVLEKNKSEELVTRGELLIKLKEVLAHHQHQLPADLQRFPSLEEKARYMIDNYCEFDVGEGEYLQWYAVRWEKGTAQEFLP